MSGIKKILKSMNVAFSLYSKLPMPGFIWNSSDMEYHLCFFPWVGTVIGFFEWLWYKMADMLQTGQILFLFVSIAIPIIVTGGFHVDGFMDTMDAIHSYRERERKLEILKDPHIGAFSVICLLTYVLVVAGFLSEISSQKAFSVLCCSFFLSRCLSGIGVVYLKEATKKGMLRTASSTAEKRTVGIILTIQMLLCSMLMLYFSRKFGLTAILMAGLSFFYYRKMSYRQFGGITGDLAGFFVTVSEGMAVVGIGIVSIL